MANFQSPKLQELERILLSYLSSKHPFKVRVGDKVYKFDEKETEEVLNFFNNSQLVVHKPVDNAVLLQKRADEEFRRRLERALFKSIYPADYQLDMLIKNLEMYLQWEDKRQRTIVAVYEPYIARAINSLIAKKKARNKRIGFSSEEEK